jgi:protein-glutamine gamma-glutamyltransferase
MTAKHDLRLERLFTSALMLTAVTSGIILSLAEGTMFPSAFTPVIAVLAWLLVDRLQIARVTPGFANVLGAIAFAVAANEFRSRNIEAKLLSGAHLIVYLTWIVLAMRKTVRQNWWIMALSVLQLAVASVLTSSPLFGVSLVAAMAVMIWTLALFSLFRVYARFHTRTTSDPHESLAVDSRRRVNAIVVRNGLQLDPSEPWVNRQLRGIVLISFLGSLVMSLFVFVLFPRIWVPGSPFADMAREGGRKMRGRTGFTETVSLGDIGQVLQSNSRVLQFELHDLKSGDIVPLDRFVSDMDMDEIRFRGNALGLYDEAKWRHGIPERLEDGFGTQVKVPSRYEVKIIQDPPVGEIVFALNPLTSAASHVRSDRVLRWNISGVLSWESFRATRDPERRSQRSYSIECPSLRESPDTTFENWTVPPDAGPVEIEQRLSLQRRIARRWFISDRLEQRLPQLHRIATELCGDVDGRVPEATCVNRVLRYLSLQSGFHYSLTIPFDDQTLDPIEDFVLNTRSGSCEYFASACTLMLQSVEIPARIVNGYVGSEMNSVSGRHEVRQKHAHSWVEAYIDHRWVTLDPTPSSSRQELVAASRSMEFFRHLNLALGDIWSRGIQNLSWEQQVAFVAPFTTAVMNVWNDIRRRGFGTSIREFFTELVTSPDKWFSWQGGVVTFLLLVIGACLWRWNVLQRLRAYLAALRRRFGVRERTTRSVIRFYVRFCGVCEAHGLSVTASATARETAFSATQFFADRLGSSELQSAPALIATAFNDVRFGHLELSPTRAESVGQALSAFSRALTRAQTPSQSVPLPS